MTPERWQQVERLFHSALELEPGERAAFLTEECADDVMLREEVEYLISSHEQPGSFMDSPAYAGAAERRRDERIAALVGQKIGPYEILSFLGEGGMGEVYLALDNRLGRKIALKLLPLHFTQEKARVLRFQQEARAASALNHPNILTIYEIGELNGLHFIATEFIEGETLRRRIVSRRIRLSEALDVAKQVASALAAAHTAAIVHRDIKPENIMLRRDGYVKVLDFGLVKLTEHDNKGSEASTLVHTDEGMVMGTVAYMSPEQARGLEVDARTDIYSLGVVLYEMVAGRTPFVGETKSDVIADILKTEPVPLSDFNQEVTVELEEIVSRMLKKDREERPQSAEDLFVHLRHLQKRLELETEVEREFGAPHTAGPKAVQAGTQRAGAAATTSKSEARNSIAVLPFANLSGELENEYFCDGLAEELLNTLAKIEDLKVAARTSAFSFRGKNANVNEIGRALGVQTVLEGSVRKSGNRLRITLQLVNTADGYHLWSERYDREMQDIFDVQEEITLAVVSALKVKLFGVEKAAVLKRYTDNTEAYQLYLKGCYFHDKFTEDGFKKSIECFRQAIDMDPNYAQAYAGLAGCYTVLGLMYAPSKEAYPRAKEAALKALELDNTLAEAHCALASVKLFYDWDWPTAKREIQVAIQLNSNYADAHILYCYYLMVKGQLQECITEVKLAQELNPLSRFINTALVWALYLARQYDQAEEQCLKTIELDPDFPPLRTLLGRAYLMKGMYHEAITEFEKELNLSGAEVLTNIGHAHAMSGNRDEAQSALDELKRLFVQSELNIDPALLAIVYAGLDERDQALEWLHKAYEYRSQNMLWLKVEPVWDGLRSDSRFIDLLRRMNNSP